MSFFSSISCRGPLPAFARLRLLLPLLLLSACSRGDEGADHPRLLILAATSLQTTMPELVAAFEARTGSGADVVFGASGNLAAQVENGAPADVILSADAVTIGRLQEAGLVRKNHRAVYATGRLALVVPERQRLPEDLAGLLDPRFEVIAIANPLHAPYGRAALEALERTGILRQVEARLIYAENVAQAFHFAASGNADAAIVALGLALASEGIGPHLLLEPAMHEPIVQEMAVVAATTHPDADDFFRFLLESEGQAILGAHGFDRPGGT